MILSHNPFFWHDLVEITFFSVILYHFSLWLRKDRQKNLLGYFYCYLGVVLGSHYASLQTLHTFLVITAPIAIVLFIIAHQEILQRNFVALATIVPAHRNELADDWLEVLMRSCLVAASHNKQLSCVIENYDSLEPFITTEYALNIPIKKSVLDLTFESLLFDPEKMLWTNSQGTLHGINAAWSNIGSNNWAEHALFISTKTDAVIFTVSPTTRNFTIFVAGNTYSHISALHALTTLKKYIHKNQKRESHAPVIQKNSQQQPTR